MSSKTDKDALIERRLMAQRLLLVALAFGVCIMLYPFVWRLYFAYRSMVVANHYAQVVEEQPSEALEEAWAAARAYNEGHRVNDVFDPFGEEPAATEERAAYLRLLNPSGDGVMGYVDIPRIGQRLNVYHGTDTQALLKGVGHLQGTSLPVGGVGTHCVLSGHRGLPVAKVFTDLDQMRVGDLIYLHVLGHVLAYEVDRTSVVLPTEVSGLAIDPAEDALTLVTCTPYAVNTHRLLVHGHSVPVPDEVGMDEELSFWARWRLWLVSIGAVLALVVGVVLVARAFAARPGARARRQRDEAGSAQIPSGRHMAKGRPASDGQPGRHMEGTTRKGSGHGR